MAFFIKLLNPLNKPINKQVGGPIDRIGGPVLVVPYWWSRRPYWWSRDSLVSEPMASTEVSARSLASIGQNKLGDFLRYFRFLYGLLLA